MDNQNSRFFDMVKTLFIVTFLASASTALVYNITEKPIENAKIAKKLAAIQEVVPAFNNVPSNEADVVYIENDSLELYPAKMDGKLVGVAVETFSDKGFSGKIKLMVGLLPDGKINDIRVIEHKETPGLGDKMEKDKSFFSHQLKGKDPAKYVLKVTKDGGDVDAITAATITSRAFCDAVQRAYDVFKTSSMYNDSIDIQ